MAARNRYRRRLAKSHITSLKSLKRAQADRSPHTPCVRERPGRYQYAVTYKGQPALTFTLFGTRPNRHYFLATRVLHLCLYFDSFKRQSVYLIVFTTPHTVSFYPFLLRTYWKRNF